MSKFVISSNDGKYAGKCPNCELTLMEGELDCKRCGENFGKPVKAKKSVPKIPEDGE